MTEPGAVFLPKPSWWVRRDRCGYSQGSYGWESRAVGGTNRLGRGGGQYGWVSSLARGSNRYDTFTRPDTVTSAGPNWVNKANSVGVHSGKAFPVYGGGQWNAAVWNTPMLTDNFVVSAAIYTNGTYENGAVALYFGCDTPGVNLLACLAFPEAGRTGLIIKSGWASTSFSWVGSVVGAATYAWGDTVSVERSGNVYTVRLNSIPCWTWTDTAVTHPIDSAHRLVGIGGVAKGASVFDIDNFLAKEL